MHVVEQLLAWFPQWRRYVFFMTALLLVGNGLELALGFFMGGVMDSVSQNEEPSTLGVLFVLGAGSCVLGYVQCYWPQVRLIALRNYWRRSWLEKFLSASMTDIKRLGIGDISGRLYQEVNLVADILTSLLVDNLSRFLISLSSLVVCLTISWRMGSIALILMPVSAEIMRRIMLRKENYSRNAVESTSRYRDYLLASIDELTLIKAYKFEESATAQFGKLSTCAMEQQKAEMRFTSLGILTSFSSNMISEVVAFGLGAWLIHRGEISLGAWVSYYYFLGKTPSFFSAWQTLLDCWRNIQVSGARLIELRDLQQEASGCSSLQVAEKGPLLVFDDVSFAYEEAQNDALHNISFQIEDGEKLAVMGESGSGKSTLMALILGLYSPTKGRVLWRGRDLCLWDVDSVRRDIAAMNANSHLFMGDVATNLNLGRQFDGGIIDADADFVARSVGIDAEMLIKNVSDLSGGQRQQALLARALYSHSIMLCLDESTSAMDPALETLCVSSILAKPCAVVQITHHHSVAERFPRCLYLKSGQLIHDGSYLGEVTS